LAIPIQFRLLGPVHALSGTTPLSVGQPKQRAVLASLLLHRGRFVSREELLEAVWGERPPPSAVGSLHVYVHGLRQILGPERIEARGEAYRIRLEPDELDLERFERLLATGRAQLAAAEPQLAVELLGEALRLWLGPALADLNPDMLRDERAQLEDRRLDAVELLAEARLEARAPGEALAELSSLIPEHPYRERLRELQILALYRLGRQQDALAAYREARAVLIEQLGIEPGARLRALELAVLSQAPELEPSAPATETVDAARAALPAPPTRLIGRGRELAEIVSLFDEAGARLVTLTGSGGSGKTRLALAVAERLATESPTDTGFVDLSGASDHTLVLPLIAQALEVPVQHPLREALASHLRPRRLLLVLDNLEHVLDCAPELAQLLSTAPALRMLTTSRAPLRLRAEYEYPVPPLSLPPRWAALEAVAASEAVQLLLERARAVNPNHRLTATTAPAFERISRRLDGLPLALELAAGRLRSASVEELAAGLDRALELLVEGPVDLPARQRTLRATLAWSYEQLDPDAQRLLARLAAFASSFAVADVEAVCGPGVAELLAGLAQVSLLQHTGTGFSILETVREYAAESLAASGQEHESRARHCRHFLALAEGAREALLAGEDQAGAFQELDAAHDNLREAFAWAAGAGEVELEVRLVCALRQFWLVRGLLAEGRALFERAVADTEAGDPQLRAQVLVYGGALLYRPGDLATARAWWEEALRLLGDGGDRTLTAHCAAELGNVAYSEGELDRAAELYECAATGFTATSDLMRLGSVRNNQAEVAVARGDLAAADSFVSQAIEHARAVGDTEALATGLHTAARLALAVGRPDRARGLLLESLLCGRELGYRELLANCVQAVAELLLGEGGDPERAARLQLAAAAGLEEIGVPAQGMEGESFAVTEQRLSDELGAEHLAAIALELRELAIERAFERAVEQALEFLEAGS
jgi:predicted ATPase/DNA-binding SARP family transcriptional activator